MKKFVNNKYLKILLSIIIILFSLYLIKSIFIPSINIIENTNSAKTGYIGGLNLPIIFSWPIAGLLAAVTAFLIGKISLGLRSDYLAIATLGISEIILYFIKNEGKQTENIQFLQLSDDGKEITEICNVSVKDMEENYYSWDPNTYIIDENKIYLPL